MIEKAQGIKVAERVFSVLDDYLTHINECGHKLNAYLEPFNNCREVGFYLTAEDEDWDNEDRVKGMLFVHVCEARGSDEIMVVVGTDYPGNKGMFSDKSYNCEGEFDFKKYFHYNEEHAAAEFISDTIKKFFKIG